MEKDRKPTSVDWGFILELEGADRAEETGDLDFEGCLRCIKESCGHLTSLRGTTISDAARIFLQRGLDRFVAYESEINIIREQKVFVERADANSVYSRWFQKDPDFALVGRTRERLHFETDVKNKRIVMALSAVLGVRWQQFVQVVLMVGMLGLKDIPLAHYRDAEKNVTNFQVWLTERAEQGAEHVNIVSQQVSEFKVVERRMNFEDILDKKKPLPDR